MKIEIIFNFGGYYCECNNCACVYIYPKYYDIYFTEIFSYYNSKIKLIELRHLNGKKYCREYKDFNLTYYIYYENNSTI